MIQRIQNIDGSIRRIYLNSDNLPDEIRNSSDKIKGDDGVERTMAEWWDHIVSKTAYADADDPTSKGLTYLQSELGKAVSLGGDHVDKFKDAAAEYMQAALLECMKKGANEESVIERLKTKVESLSRSIGNTKWRKQGRAALGECLLHYIEENHDLPRSRKELQLFSKNVSDGGIPKETIRDHLDWYDLEKVCATRGI